MNFFLLCLLVTAPLTVMAQNQKNNNEETVNLTVASSVSLYLGNSLAREANSWQRIMNSQGFGKHLSADEIKKLAAKFDDKDFIMIRSYSTDAEIYKADLQAEAKELRASGKKEDIKLAEEKEMQAKNVKGTRVPIFKRETISSATDVKANLKSHLKGGGKVSLIQRLPSEASAKVLKRAALVSTTTSAASILAAISNYFTANSNGGFAPRSVARLRGDRTISGKPDDKIVQTDTKIQPKAVSEPY